MAIKLVILIAWLGAAYGFHTFPLGRKIFAYLGAAVAFVHVGAIAGTTLLNWYTGRTSVEGGVNVAGFAGGCLVGFILGLVLGSFAVKNDFVYWISQVAAAAFLAFFPL